MKLVKEGGYDFDFEVKNNAGKTAWDLAKDRKTHQEELKEKMEEVIRNGTYEEYVPWGARNVEKTEEEIENKAETE